MIFIVLIGKFLNFCEVVMLIIVVIFFVDILIVFNGYFVGEVSEIFVFEIIFFILIVFEIEFFGMIFVMFVSGLWILNLIYFIGYMCGNKEEN